MPFILVYRNLRRQQDAFVARLANAPFLGLLFWLFFARYAPYLLFMATAADLRTLKPYTGSCRRSESGRSSSRDDRAAFRWCVRLCFVAKFCASFDTSNQACCLASQSFQLKKACSFMSGRAVLGTLSRRSLSRTSYRRPWWPSFLLGCAPSFPTAQNHF